jgi:hypothetical protein
MNFFRLLLPVLTVCSAAGLLPAKTPHGFSPIGYDDPVAAVRQYLHDQSARAATTRGFWKEQWRIEREPKEDELRLGRPFSRYRVLDDELEVFVRSGDLLGAALLTDVSYPVFDRLGLIGTIQVAESNRQWSFVSRHLIGSPVDSLAAFFGERGDSVAVVGGKSIGAVMLIRHSDHTDVRALPLGYTQAFFSSGMDSNGTVSYTTACEVLRAVAEERLRLRRARIPEQE